MTLNQPSKSNQLRQLLEQPGVVAAPCAYDCVSVRLVEWAGFRVALHGGFNVAASLLGIPDIGLISMAEAMQAARNMATAVDIPVICDVDDGFGGLMNVTRVTAEAIRSGLAGMYIEDQALPKRCPSLGGGQVIPTQDMVKKLRAALKIRAREDPDFVIIARTHASRAVNFEEAVKRGIVYAQEGADLIWVDLGYDESVLEELAVIRDRIGPHGHVIANMTENVGRPMLTNEELYQMGFKMVVYPLTLILTAAKAMNQVLHELSEKGTTREMSERMMPVSEFAELVVKMDEVRRVEQELENLK